MARGGEGKGGLSRWPITACLLSLQYFSTLENSIVSLFVLLTTAK